MDTTSLRGFRVSPWEVTAPGWGRRTRQRAWGCRARATHLLLLEAGEVPAVIEPHLFPLPVLHEGGSCSQGGDNPKVRAEKPSNHWMIETQSPLLHHLVSEGDNMLNQELHTNSPVQPSHPPVRQRLAHFPILQMKKLRRREINS